MNVVQGMLGGQRSLPREFYIDGVTYLSSGSDFVTQGPCILYSGNFTQVSVKSHVPSGKEIVEKKIRKKDNNKKYIDIERDMINITHSDFIVHFFGYLEDRVDMFLYMERMACCFRQLLCRVVENRTRFPTLLLHSVAFNVVSALIFLKDYNILHRDIKPSNILLSDQGQIKLGDFGLSKESENGTALSKGIGTYEYNAPERLGPERLDHGYPSDLWSLGITLHELTNLEHPIRKIATDARGNCSKMELMIVVTNQDPPQLCTQQIDSHHFCEFVNSCLKKIPEDRIPLTDILSHPVFNSRLSDKDITSWLQASG